MFLRRLACFLVALFILLDVRDAFASDAPPRRVFALVVANNRSFKLDRPELHYADDDGARYHALFRTMTPDANVTLLTSFDRDSARLFPDLASRVAAPEKARVLAAFRDFGARVREAVGRGELVDFYFVFAGHGDIDAGKGFLELADGKLVSDELTSLVASVPATRTHVILDSCNSFFVINARKPGGRRFVTAAEAGERLNRSLPNVGVFLSTSAEAETFEWSELGAGVFSHTVRSGLSGAADADRDGNVSYDELAAFVHTAAKNVKNPRFRPSVFARGPSGHGAEAIARLGHAKASKLELPRAAGRVTLRDADDLPWLDAHLEPSSGAPVQLYVPDRIVEHATLDVDGERFAIERRDGNAGLVLKGPEANLKIATRGPDELFKSLFAIPFGPRAFAQYQEEVARAPAPVYGVASDDVQRLKDIFRQASENARADRKLQGMVFAAFAGLYAGTAVLNVTVEDDVKHVPAQAVQVTVAASLSLWSFLRSSREEKAYAWFSREVERGASVDLMAMAEAKLFALAKQDREERLRWRWIGIAALAANAAVYSALTVDRIERDQDPMATAAVGFTNVVAIAIPVIGTFSPTYTERLADLWARDPSRARLETTVASGYSIRPFFGGTSIGLGGTF